MNGKIDASSSLSKNNISIFDGDDEPSRENSVVDLTEFENYEDRIFNPFNVLASQCIMKNKLTMLSNSTSIETTRDTQENRFGGSNSSCSSAILMNTPSERQHDMLRTAVHYLVGISQKPIEDVETAVMRIMMTRDLTSFDADGVVEICSDAVFSIPSSTSSSSSGTSHPIQLKNDSPISEILLVFPKAKKSFVASQLAAMNNSVEDVVSSFMDYGYEKEEIKFVTNNSNLIESQDFSMSCSFEPSPLYQEQAYLMIQSNFPYFNVSGLKTILKDKKHAGHYFLSVRTIETTLNIEANMNIFNDYREIQTSSTLPLNDPIFLEKMKCLGLKLKQSKSKAVGFSLKDLDSTLREEFRWMCAKKRSIRETKDRDLAEKLNEEMAQEEGNLLECGCCYSEYAFEQLVQCSEGDLFCKNCVKIYVETTVYGEGRSCLRCMSTGPITCNGTFSDEMLRLSLPTASFEKYQETAARDAIKAANIVGICTCYSCGVVAEVNESRVMACPSCAKETCCLCGDESHIPFRCEEVEKKAQTEVRLTVEEAMTNARIRQCHKCKSRFFKTEGCNKMTCSCGAKICYICRKDITKEGYAHFCQAPLCDHSKCSKCVLFSKSAEDDRLAMLEAGTKALDGQSRDKDVIVNVDVNKLLEVASATTAVAPRVMAPAIPAFIAVDPRYLGPAIQPLFAPPVPPMVPVAPLAADALANGVINNFNRPRQRKRVRRERL